MPINPILPVTLAGLLTLAIGAGDVNATPKCIDRVDVSDVSGLGSGTIAKTICDASVMSVVLESARVWDTYFDAFGNDLLAANFDALNAGEITSAELMAQSAKIVDIEFWAGGIMALKMSTLRKKIEKYMAETYTALFSQTAVPLLQVKISALYPMDDGSQAIVYGTSIRNEGCYSPGNLLESWQTWRLNRSLQQ